VKPASSTIQGHNGRISFYTIRCNRPKPCGHVQPACIAYLFAHVLLPMPDFHPEASLFPFVRGTQASPAVRTRAGFSRQTRVAVSAVFTKNKAKTASYVCLDCGYLYTVSAAIGLPHTSLLLFRCCYAAWLHAVVGMRIMRGLPNARSLFAPKSTNPAGMDAAPRLGGTCVCNQLLCASVCGAAGLHSL
jgi:hypothetical protein